MEGGLKMKISKRLRRWGIGGVVALGIAVYLLNSALPLEVQAVRKGKVTSTVLEKGELVSLGSANIYSEVQGKVKTLTYDVGDQVQAGQVLAVLDSSEVDQQIMQKEGEIKALAGQEAAARSQSGANRLAQQQAMVDQARTALNLAEADYARMQQLYKAGAVNYVELEQALADKTSKRQALAQVQAALAALRKQGGGDSLNFAGQRESLQAQLNNLVRQKAKASIAADVPGVIFARKIKAGDYVSPGMLLYTIGSTDKLTVEVYVNSKDMANIHKGDRVTVTVKQPGQDLELPGLISKIAPSTEERVSALGVTEDQVKVTVELKTNSPARADGPDGAQGAAQGTAQGTAAQKPPRFFPGMSVDVTLTTQKTADVLYVPKDAVFSEGEQDYLWVVKEGKAHLTKVTAGVEGDDTREIQAGVNEGELVIVNPNEPKLKEGLKVKPLNH